MINDSLKVGWLDHVVLLIWCARKNTTSQYSISIIKRKNGGGGKNLNGIKLLDGTASLQERTPEEKMRMQNTLQDTLAVSFN
jgi:hypothetical protein